MSNAKTYPMICGCGRPIAMPARGSMEVQLPARHLGIPGEPITCPK